MKKLSFYLRIVRVLVHVVRGVLICLMVFPWLDAAAKQVKIQMWSQQLLAIFRIRVKMNVVTMPLRSIIVSNHISWLDIFVLNSLAPCRFVAKSDIRSWPLIGWLSEQVGTIFIARGNGRDVLRIHQVMAEQIAAGERIAFFPEGTTAAQGQILPFHANLFEAAIQAAVPIQPFAMRYVGPEGDLHHAVDYIGEMTLAESIGSILLAGDIVVHLLSLEPISSDNVHRRELALIARGAVAAALQVDITS